MHGYMNIEYTYDGYVRPLREAVGSDKFSSTVLDSNPSGYLKLFIC